MGYEKEIILVKKDQSTHWSPIELIDLLKKTVWKPTLFILDRGTDFNWTQLELSEDGEAEFRAILKDKSDVHEFIGFTIKHKINNRFTTVNIDGAKIIFTLDIGRHENEMKWFQWFDDNLIQLLQGLIQKTCRIEWRTGYDNEIIRQIEKM